MEKMKWRGALENFEREGWGRNAVEFMTDCLWSDLLPIQDLKSIQFIFTSYCWVQERRYSILFGILEPFTSFSAFFLFPLEYFYFNTGSWSRNM